jgi:hypothetical protein
MHSLKTSSSTFKFSMSATRKTQTRRRMLKPPKPPTPRERKMKLPRVARRITMGNQVTLPILFLPFELGIHKANIIFTDENVGEV